MRIDAAENSIGGGVGVSIRPGDLELARRVRRGDSAAFDELVAKHASELFKLAFSLMNNAADAEDVVQQTFLGAFQRISAFEGRSSLKTWLVRILVNQAYKARRSKRVRKSEHIDIDESYAHGEPVLQTRSAVSATEARVDLAQMLEHLSPEHREIIVLRELQGLSYDEIASVLRVARGTVESRLFRARQDLRRRFEGYFS